jgi:hypothetical protein
MHATAAAQNPVSLTRLRHVAMPANELRADDEIFVDRVMFWSFRVAHTWHAGRL